ncbi:hypothetical protein T265_04527 [Opisthorchis viverrini]|uniref:C2H2-type domain-containing protein n=1 Tax=Opisthorchis viverrini TaxID=6198 RepID=A0A074ZNR5_OPIVI|nr:hypothetical protein T265_04527 [Opisthorchis viverrini]KER28741.1 hypothetical protein T265_04527 [Opisthorchis viverrini]
MSETKQSTLEENGEELQDRQCPRNGHLGKVYEQILEDSEKIASCLSRLVISYKRHVTQAAKCDHDAQLKDQLRDRPISDIRSSDLQQELLLYPNQKSQTIRKICEQYEDVRHVSKTDESVLLSYSKREKCDNFINAKHENPNELNHRQRDEATQGIQPAQPDKTETPKQHKCGTCGKSFKVPSLLLRHAIMHTTSKNYECEFCRKTFKYVHNLRNHRLLVHASDESNGRLRIYTCEVCGKRAASQKDLKSHMRVHSRQRPFACDLCDWSFATSSNLYRHRRALHPQTTQDA